MLGINGAAAHLVHPGDLVILITYAQMSRAEALDFVPKIVHVNERNQMVKLGTDPAESVTEGLSRPPFAVSR